MENDYTTRQGQPEKRGPGRPPKDKAPVQEAPDLGQITVQAVRCLHCGVHTAPRVWAGQRELTCSHCGGKLWFKYDRDMRIVGVSRR
jgi:hypothetical protein